jgi:hypothetical protein
MQSRRFWLLLITACIVLLTARLLYQAARLETGWAALATLLQDSLLGGMGAKATPLSFRNPEVQADFWLKEADRILAENPHDAQLALGAAWLLDSPSVNYISRFMDSEGRNQLVPNFAGVKLDRNRIAGAENAREAKCRDRLLDLAKKAAELAPQEPLYWRSRALLASQMGLYSQKAIRVTHPLPIWEECAKHDPDNALYDYLIAEYLLGQASTEEWSDATSSHRIVVNDQQQFDRGLTYLKQAQAKPFYAGAEMALAAVSQFLAASNLPIHEHPDFAVSRLENIRSEKLLLELWRFHQYRIHSFEDKGDLAAASAEYQQQLRLATQVRQSDDTSRYYSGSRLKPIYAIQRLEQNAVDSPSTIPEAKRKELERMKADTESWARLLVEIATLVSAEKESCERPAWIVWAIISTAAIRAAAVMLVAAGFSWLARRTIVHEKSQSVRLGFLRSAIVWMVAGGLVFLFFGLGRSGVLGFNAPRHLSTAIVYCGEALLLAAAIFFILRMVRKGVRQGRQVKAAVVACLVLFSFLPLFHLVLRPIHEEQPVLFPKIPNIGDVPADRLRYNIHGDMNDWQWAAVLWHLWNGWLLTCAAATVGLVLWYVVRVLRQRTNDHTLTEPLLSRQTWSGLLQTLQRSYLFAGTLCLLVWLVVVPSLLAVNNAKYLSQMNYARNPATYYENLRIAAEANLMTP